VTDCDINWPPICGLGLGLEFMASASHLWLCKEAAKKLTILHSQLFKWEVHCISIYLLRCY